MKKTIILGLLFVVLFAGCTKKAKVQEVTKPEDAVVIVEEQPEEQLQVVEQPVEEIKTEVAASEFKVQIFATYNEEKANKLATELRGKFTETVYVEFIAPYYKVRLGKYTSKLEAEALRDRAREMGYSDAFVVVP